MAEVLGIASAIASLVTIAAQITTLSYGYISDIKSASKSQKAYLRELSALTDVLLRVDQALESTRAQKVLNRAAAFSSGVMEECQKQLSDLKTTLERHVMEDGRLKRLKSTLIWPFEEKEVKSHIDMIHKYRSIFADTMAADIL